MIKRIFAALALSGILLAGAPAALAQDSKGDALLELLIKKGVITKEDADGIRKDWDKQLADRVLKHDKTKVAGWIKEMAWSGDIRLRHESFWWDQNTEDRHRERMRVRFGFTSKFADDKTTFGLRLATGSLGDPVSANQTMGDVFGRKTIGFDQLYIKYDADKWVSFWAGKFPYPWYLAPVDSRMIWDDDANPEGLAECFKWKLSDNVTVFANAAQMPLLENYSATGSPGDVWLFFEQIGIDGKFSDKVSGKLAVQFFHSSNVPEVSRATYLSGMRGNTRSGNFALEDYDVFGVAGELNWKLGDGFIKSLTLAGEFSENIEKKFTETTGWTLGLRLNSAKKKGDWDFAYFYKYQEADAAWDALADSDWANGGTDRKGHIFTLSYQLQDWWGLRARLFANQKISNFSNGVVADDLIRLQLDSSWRF